MCCFVDEIHPPEVRWVEEVLYPAMEVRSSI